MCPWRPLARGILACLKACVPVGRRHFSSTPLSSMKRDERIRPPSFTSLTPLYPTPLHIIHWHGNATPSLSSSALRVCVWSRSSLPVLANTTRLQTSTALGGVHTYNIPAPQSLVFLPPLHPYQSKELNSSPVTPIPSLAPNNNRFSAAPAGFDASNSRSPVLCDGPSKHPSDAEVRHFLGFHQGQKLDLDSLKDPPPGHRPSQIIKHLAVLAILGSPDRKLTFDGICNALERRFEWFRLRASGEEASWKVSRCFGFSGL